MDTALIVSIVLAVISLLGTVVIAFLNFFGQDLLNRWTEERSDQKETDALIQKYGQPIMMAAYELQARMYELCQYPISKAHLESKEGLQDLKKYTCYKVAQYMAWTHLLRTKAQFFSFVDNPDLKNIIDGIWRIDEEFDRRRGFEGCNVGVWPGSRVLVSERMLIDAKDQPDVPVDTVIRGFDDFLKLWSGEDGFAEPMGYFCQWIDDLVEARKIRIPGWDEAFRNTQHNLVDLVRFLQEVSKSKTKMFGGMRKVLMKSGTCDCKDCRRHEGHYKEEPLDFRADSRLNDRGLRPWYKYYRWSPQYDSETTLGELKKLTCKTGFDHSKYERLKGSHDWRKDHWSDHDRGEYAHEEDGPRRGMLAKIHSDELDEKLMAMDRELEECEEKTSTDRYILRRTNSTNWTNLHG